VLAHDDDDLTFIPTLQYWGVPENPTRLDLRIWETQELFLRLYARSGKFVRSADATGISRQCIYKWEKADKFSFNKRLEIAHQEYVEHLEEEMDEYIRESKHNIQILQIFRLKAEWPEKYGDNVQITTDAPVKQMLEQMRQIGLAQQKAASTGSAQGLEQGAAEGEYRDLDAGPQH
jgi:predicted DNA-binding transcriptional regulator AlpA